MKFNIGDIFRSGYGNYYLITDIKHSDPINQFIIEFRIIYERNGFSVPGNEVVIFQYGQRQLESLFNNIDNFKMLVRGGKE